MRMIEDLTKVPIRPVSYKGKITVSKEYYENMDILDIQDVYLEMEIYKNLDQEDLLHIKCEGKLLLQDARDLKPVLYPFSFEFEEKIDSDSEICGRFLENSQNTLDIMAILWENIVLEKPISYTVCDSLESPKDDAGWKIVGEENEKTIDPRLAPLMELLEKKKE